MFDAPISSGVASQSQLLRVALQGVSNNHLHQVRATILARQMEGPMATVTAAAAAGGDAIAPVPPSALNSMDGFLALCQVYFVSPLAAYRVAASSASNALPESGVGAELAPSETSAVTYFMRIVERELQMPSVAPPHDNGCWDDAETVGCRPPLAFPLSPDCAVLLVALMVYYQSQPCAAGVDGIQLLRSVFDECVEKEEAQRRCERRRHSDGSSTPQLNCSMSFATPQDGTTNERRVRWKTVLEHLESFCSAHYHAPHRLQGHQHHEDDTKGRVETATANASALRDAKGPNATSLLQLLTAAVGLPQPLQNPSDTNDTESSPEWSPSVSPRSRRPVNAASPERHLPPETVSVSFDEFLTHLRNFSFAEDRDRSRWTMQRRCIDNTALSTSSGSPNTSPLPHRWPQGHNPSVFDPDPEYSEAAGAMGWLGDLTASFLPEDELEALNAAPLHSSPLLSTPSTAFASVALESISCVPRIGLVSQGASSLQDGSTAPLLAGAHALTSIVAQLGVVDALSSSRMATHRKSAVHSAKAQRAQSIAGGTLLQHQHDASPTVQMRAKIDQAVRRTASVRTDIDAKMQRTASKAKHGLHIMEATTGDARPASLAVLQRERLLNSRSAAGTSYAPSMTHREADKLAEILGDYSASQELTQLENNRVIEARAARDNVRALQRRNLMREAARIDAETSRTQSLVAHENGLVHLLAQVHILDGARASSSVRHTQARKAAHALSVLQNAKHQSASLINASSATHTDHRPLPTPTPGPGESPAKRRRPSPLLQMTLGSNSTLSASPVKEDAVQPHPLHHGTYELVVEADGVGVMRTSVTDVYSFPDLLEALDDLLAPFQHQHRRSLRGGGKRVQMCSTMPHHGTNVQRQRVSDVFVDASRGVGASRFVPLGSIDELPQSCKVRVLFGQ